MRNIQKINSDWYFLKGDTKRHRVPKRPDKKWVNIDLPHTWNAEDGQDGGFDYFRSPCWYFKELEIAPVKGTVAYLEIPAASLKAEVYVNGRLVCTHKGGFSTFRADITPFIKRGKAKIAICVDNSEATDVYPQTADFTFFGGLYRGVNLITASRAHFDLDFAGGCGVVVTPKMNDNGSADIEIEAFVTNGCNCAVEYKIGELTAAGKKAVIHIDEPHLWNGRIDPHLYTLEANLLTGNTIVDNVTVKFGIRRFSVDPEKGFFLNGEPYPLHGVSRHQDRENMGWDNRKRAQGGYGTHRRYRREHHPPCSLSARSVFLRSLR